jgi:hypothetical protein
MLFEPDNDLLRHYSMNREQTYREVETARREIRQVLRLTT